VRDQAQAGNQARKEALIAQALQLADTAERAKATGIVTSHDIIRRIKDLQAQWKDIGHVPRDQVEPTWQQWKAALDRCWATVKDHTDAIAAERAANQAKKEALIAEAETIAAGENARWFKEDIKSLIKQWRDVGPCDRAIADELEVRFRSTCDRVLKLDG
jgi:predicted Rdx family selenoprotein